MRRSADWIPLQPERPSRIESIRGRKGHDGPRGDSYGHAILRRPSGAARLSKLTCQEVLDQLADYLEPDAHTDLVHQVNQHLGLCHHCRIEVDRLKGVVRIFRHEEIEIHLPGPLADRLQKALEQAYRGGCCTEDGGAK